MTWHKVIFSTLAIVATASVSNGVLNTENVTSRLPPPSPSVVRVVQRTGSASFARSTPLHSRSEPMLDSVSKVRPVPFATFVDTMSESRSLFGRSSTSSRMAGSPIESSADVAITVTPSASFNYSALITDDASGASYKLATPLTAKSSVIATYRNWVGPRVVQGDSACWREAHIMDVCPSQYDRNEVTNTCWTQCPIEFPIKCGMECIRQNDGCGREVFYKIGSIVNVGLNGIMDNWFGKFRAMSKAIRTATMCACMVLGEIRAILRYVRSVKTSDPQVSRDRLLTMLFQSNAVVVELPITIKLCMGGTASSQWWLADRIVASTQYLLSQILSHEDYLITSFDRFNAFLRGANFTVMPEMMTDGEIQYLKHALESNSTCGHDLQGLVERAWLTIESLKEQHPGITKDELRVKIQDTQLAKTDIARVTSNCMGLLIQQSDERTAYTTRDTIRKTFGVIFNDLITKGVSNNGSSYKANEYTYQWLNQGLNFWVATGFDMSGISSMISEYFQSICGPTQFIGEVDDGSHPDTLGINTIQNAFKNSTMMWTRKGDGRVIISFTSNDTEDVTVNIMSGGNKIDEINVAAGKRATWKSTVSILGGKTLYLDRWRPGFLGLPGTGGGSLMLWVPHAAEGGHLDLNVHLNVS